MEQPTNSVQIQWKTLGFSQTFTHGVLISRPQIPIITLPQIFPLKILKNSKSTNAIYRPPPSPRRTHQSRRPGEKTRDRIHSLWCGPCPCSKRASQCYLDETNDDRPRCLHGRCVLLSAPTHLCPLAGRSMHWPRPPTASLLTRRHLVNFVIFNFNLIGIQLVIVLKLNQLTLNFF